MFSLIWRFFPGPAWLRAFVLLAILAALVYWLMYYGYPWAAQTFGSNETSTIESTP